MRTVRPSNDRASAFTGMVANAQHHGARSESRLDADHGIEKMRLNYWTTTMEFKRQYKLDLARTPDSRLVPACWSQTVFLAVDRLRTHENYRDGVWCCERGHECRCHGFSLHQGLAWGTIPPESHHWRKWHAAECGGNLIQLVEPCGEVPI